MQIHLNSANAGGVKDEGVSVVGVPFGDLYLRLGWRDGSSI